MSVDQTPILIAGPPRSGTTMLAGLLSTHGVWVGRARTTQYPDTNVKFGSENQDIKAIMKRIAAGRGYRNWNVPLPDQPDFWNGIKEEVEAFVPANTSWLVKTSWTLVWHEFWTEAYPHAQWVLPYRNVLSTLDSIARHPGMSRNHPPWQRRTFVEALQRRQSQVAAQVRESIVVDVYRVSRGDRDSILALFEFLQITPQWEKINQWIQPGKMKQ